MKLSILISIALIIFIISFLPIDTNGQIVVKTYDSQWKIVEDYLNKGLPKSALTEVKKNISTGKK